MHDKRINKWHKNCKKINCCEIGSITLVQRHMKLFNVACNHWTLFRDMYASIPYKIQQEMISKVDYDFIFYHIVFIDMLDRDEMNKFYRGPVIDASYQVSVHLAKRFQRIFFRNLPARNKNCLWWPCLLTDRDKMNNLYKGPSIDASDQVSVHMAMWFQRRK